MVSIRLSDIGQINPTFTRIQEDSVFVFWSYHLIPSIKSTKYYICSALKYKNDNKIWYVVDKNS